MSEVLKPCEHRLIQRWRLMEGELTNLWACVECRLRFEPVENKRTPEHKDD